MPHVGVVHEGKGVDKAELRLFAEVVALSYSKSPEASPREPSGRTAPARV